MKKVIFNGETYILDTRRYESTDRVCLLLLDPETKLPAGRCSLNAPDVDLEIDEIIIKNYAENEGMLEALISAEVVSEPVRIVRTGFIKAPVCKLLIESKIMETMSLKEYVEKGRLDGFIACSKNISDTGFLKIQYVMSDWWIKASNGMSYSCCPSEIVYFNK